MSLEEKIKRLSAEQVLQLKEKLKPNLSANKKKVESSTPEPLAIIGLSFRFPGSVNDRESFWQLLKTGQDAVTQKTLPRYHSDASLKANFSAGFIEDVNAFDASFFNISYNFFSPISFFAFKNSLPLINSLKSFAV